MHARELVELASLVAVETPLLLGSRAAIPAASIEEYWTASKCRLDRWSRSLKRLTHQTVEAGERPRLDWAQLRGIVEEILTGEVLARVWTAAMHVYDRRRGTNHVGPIARSVLIGQMEARHRVLGLLVSGPGLRAEEGLRLNHFRSRTERWSDLLLAYLMAWGDVAEFAVDTSRARDFADDVAEQRKRRGGRHVWPIVLASLRAAFYHAMGPASPNTDLNARIASGIVGCFPAELFDQTGLPQSAWMARIARITDDAQGMLDQLLTPSKSGAPGNLSTTSPSNRLRRFGSS